MVIDLYKIHQENEINYKSLAKDLYFKNQVKDKVDISVIIPVRGRLEFQKSVADHFLMAQLACLCGIDVTITYVEHSITPEYLQPTQSSYIWIPCKTESRFNKCLCFNAGFLYGPKADFYLFHDADLICPEDFFDKIVSNLSGALQPFKNKRVLYASEELTKSIVSGETIYNDKLPLSEITPGTPGAPGGSIFLSRELFIKTGGYDAEFFYGYSIEDQFFHNKISHFQKVESIDSLELIHLYHGTTHALTPPFQMSILKHWNILTKDQQGAYIQYKSDILKNLL